MASKEQEPWDWTTFPGEAKLRSKAAAHYGKALAHLWELDDKLMKTGGAIAEQKTSLANLYLSALTLRICNDIRGIAILLSHGQVLTTHALLRCLFERTVNVCFITREVGNGGGPDERARRLVAGEEWQIQKALKLLQKEQPTALSQDWKQLLDELEQRNNHGLPDLYSRCNRLGQDLKNWYDRNYRILCARIHASDSIVTLREQAARLQAGTGIEEVALWTFNARDTAMHCSTLVLLVLDELLNQLQDNIGLANEVTKIREDHRRLFESNLVDLPKSSREHESMSPREFDELNVAEPKKST